MNLLNLTLLAAHEPWVYSKGWIVTLVGFCIVILALAILSIIFGRVAAYFTKQDAKKLKVSSEKLKVVESKKLSTLNSQLSTAKGEIPADVITAIGLALYLANNQHDEESNVITIEHHQTSWNDKNYGVRHWNR